MPSFTEYQDVEMEIEIDPSDYLDACDKYEIDELIEELTERKLITTEMITGDHYDDLGKAIMKLANPYNRIVLTVEEEQILEKMASRFL
jgi:hypothetical protein